MGSYLACRLALFDHVAEKTLHLGQAMANNGGSPGAAPNPLMEYVQGKIMEGMMGQVDGMIDKATAPQGGMEGLLSAVGPLLAQKFAEPAAPPAPVPGGEQ